MPDAAIAWICSDATYNTEAIYNIVQQRKIEVPREVRNAKGP